MYFEQLRNGMRELARAGLAHGDLSPYNVLAQAERVVSPRSSMSWAIRRAWTS